MIELAILRLKKLLFVAFHPGCWRAFALGVAPSIEHIAMLKSISADLVLDIGANCGQFALIVRMMHRSIPVKSYEPLPDAAATYRRVHRGTELFELYEVAVGDENGNANLHISARADSSSMLPIAELQEKLFPNTGEVGTISVKMVTLDSLKSHWDGADDALLKIDVQGFELKVLQGAVLALARCKYVYVECSEMPLYTGQAIRSEVTAFLRDNGFVELQSYNASMSAGKLVQADYLFVRARR